MARRKWLLLLGIVIVAFSAAMLAGLFPPLRSSNGFERPGAVDLSRAEAMFAAGLGAPKSSEWREEASDLGWQARDAEGFAQLVEPFGNCQGRGVYLIGLSPDAAPTAMTAPHRGADKHTGTLAAMFAEEGKLAAAAWNSAPRRKSAECDAFGDLAKAEEHFFTAFALSFAQAYPQGRVVQLHGFDRDNRQSLAGSEADIIISDGTDQPGDRLLALSECLTISLQAWNVRVYPLDAPELGALKNAQGAALREQGFEGFTHIEMSLNLRLALRKDTGLRAQFLNCFKT